MKLEDGYNLVMLYDRVLEKDNKLKSIKYKVLKNLISNNPEVIKDAYDEKVEYEDNEHFYMVVRCENNKVVECENMVFGYCGDGSFFIDCVEHDFLVYASLAFNHDFINDIFRDYLI